MGVFLTLKEYMTVNVWIKLIDKKYSSSDTYFHRAYKFVNENKDKDILSLSLKQHDWVDQIIYKIEGLENE